ncbi:hypothetical protein ACIA8C_22130 [Nocardia sp. NPDC051321]|uniref:hypothetical protein n=1 Tax=Nocardia sp. NPDC051321 TaxID=3364323 RepID=UPI0037903452
MSGDRTSGFFRRAAEGREVSGGGIFGRGGKGRDQAPEGQEMAGSGRSTDGPDADATDAPDMSDGGFFKRSRAGDQAGNPERDTASQRTHTDQTAGTEDSGRRADAHANRSTDGPDMGDTAGTGQPKGAASEGVPEDGMAEFVAELKLLAESVLERVEPVLRQAADGQVEWSSCSWCPVCAAAALMRGQHHEVLQTVADHGTAIVTVLREALAGVPVDPVMPESDATGGPQHNHDVPQDNSPRAESTAGPHTSRTAKRSRYVSIPVTIKG